VIGSLQFYEKSVAKANLLMFTWFNTAFLPEDAPSHVLKLPRTELDKVLMKKDNIYPPYRSCQFPFNFH
jgi:hypothetical protein